MLFLKKIAAVVALIFLTLPPAFAETFYEGKRLTMNISARPGGGYDAYARLVARHLGSFLPGKPTFVSKNMPGAGGLTAANYLYNNAPRDGTEIGIFSRYLLIAPLMKMENVRFNAKQFSWIGSANNEVGTVVVWHTAPVDSMAEVFERETLVGGTGATYQNEIFPRIYNKLLGTKFKVISGYDGSTKNVLLAMQRGEVHGNGDWSYSSVRKNSDLLKSGKLKILMQAGLARHPELKDVPLVFDYVKDDDSRRILELLLAPRTFGRPFGAPPNVPEERVEALRSAFAKIVKDAAFLEEAKQMKLEIEFTPGTEIEKKLTQFANAPESLLEEARRLMKPVER